jgi:hypothetical protein
MTHPAEAALDEIIAEYLAPLDRLIALRSQRALPGTEYAPLAPGDEAISRHETSGRYPVGMHKGVR